MADLIYNTFREYMADNTIDMDNDTFKICLLADTYTPDAEAHTVYADISANEITGTGYTATGVALTSVVWTRAAATVTFDAADPTWSSATFTARYAVIYSDTPTSPADPLVCLIDFLGNKSVSNGTFTINFNASGILTLG